METPPKQIIGWIIRLGSRLDGSSDLVSGLRDPSHEKPCYFLQKLEEVGAAIAFSTISKFVHHKSKGTSLQPMLTALHRCLPDLVPGRGSGAQHGSCTI